MKAKERHRINLLKYLGNPENDFPRRVEFPAILGIRENTMYFHFSPAELSEIENEAVELRKRNSGPQRAETYKALYEAAKSGNVKAIREFLNRTEGKVTDKKEISINEGTIAEVLQEIDRMRGNG